MDVERRLAAILAADVEGYSRLMGVDEEGTLSRLTAHRREVFDPGIARHNGRIVKTTGDGLLAEFASVVDAVRCAAEVQAGMAERNASGDGPRIDFRIGINLGDIVWQDGDIFGDGVNIAARLEGIAEPGGIAISASVREQVGDRLALAFEDIGEKILKNIAKPLRVFRVRSQGGANLLSPSNSTVGLPVKPSLAVLPFQNMSGEVEQEYFGDGVVEDIITALSRFRSFAVVARNSSFLYKGHAVDVRQVAKDLGVRYVLEGSVRRSGERLRITAQLVDGTSGAHIWAQNFDGALDDVFDFQDRITENVAMLIEPQIRTAEIERARRERPGSVAAYDIYLQTLPKMFSESAKDNADACALLMKALVLEPDNPLLLSQAAWALEHRNAMGWPPIGADDGRKCLDFARRGLEHAAGDPTVMTFCGMTLLQSGKEYDRGMAVIKAAAEANPNSLMVVLNAGIAHLHCGDIEDSLTYFQRAIRLSPRDPMAYFALTGIAHTQMILGNYTEALAWAVRSLALNTNFGPTLWMLIAANALLGRLDEAGHFLNEFRKIAPEVTVASIWAGQPHKDPSRMAAVLDGLRLAGLDEG